MAQLLRPRNAEPLLLEQQIISSTIITVRHEDCTGLLSKVFFFFTYLNSFSLINKSLVKRERSPNRWLLLARWSCFYLAKYSDFIDLQKWSFGGTCRNEVQQKICLSSIVCHKELKTQHHTFYKYKWYDLQLQPFLTMRGGWLKLALKMCPIET